MMTLRKDAKIGLIHFMAYPQVIKGDGPVVETLRKILVDDYFDLVEVTRVNDPGTAREVASMLKQSHISVAFGAQPVLLINKLNLNALETGERQKAVQAIMDCFDQAALFGATGVAVLAGPCEKGREQDAEKVLVASLVELSRKAAGYHLNLALEIFDDTIDKKALVGKAALAAKIGKEVRKECPNFGLMHDLSHCPLLGETPLQALEPIKHLLVHAHLGNAVVRDKTHPAYGDQHPRFGIEGGSNDVEETRAFLKALYAIGFLGKGERKPLSFEVKPMPGEDSDLIIANAKRVLNQACNFIEG